MGTRGGRRLPLQGVGGCRVPSRPLLFRQEAVDFQQHSREWGRVALLEPLAIKVTTWFIAMAVGLIVIYLFKAEYARKESVVGYLTPTLGTSKIFAPQQGTIREIYVKEGDQVEEGQPLLTVETNQIAANGRDVNATMLDTLTSQKDLLTHQITAEWDCMRKSSRPSHCRSCIVRPSRCALSA